MTKNDQATQAMSVQPAQVPLKSWLIKFIPLALMQMLAIFSYNCLRTLKDSVIFMSTAEASTVVWLKSLVIMPLSLILTMSYAKLCSRLGENRQKANYFVLSLFVVFYLGFVFLFLPMEASLQFPLLAKKLISFSFLPRGLAEGIGNVFGYWGFSIFYGMSELFGAMLIQIVCWRTATEICSKEERDKFFPSLPFIGQIGGYIGSTMIEKLGLGKVSNAEFKIILSKILLLIVVLLFVMGVVYYFIERTIIDSPELKGRDTKSKKKSETPGFKEVFGILASNPYLRKVAIIVLSYNICIALVETSWKDAVITYYGAAQYRSIHPATLAINSLATFIMAFLSTVVLSNLSLVIRAMLPVFMMGVTGVIFLLFFVWSDSPFVYEIMSTFGLAMYTPMQLAVVIGCVQNIGAKSAKYSSFDSSKEEMLAAGDLMERERGKSAIDVTVARLGKSFSGMIQAILIIIVPSASMFVSSIIGTISSTPSLEVAKPATEIQRKVALKKIMDCIRNYEIKFDEKTNEYSMNIPAQDGVKFSEENEGFKISAFAEDETVDAEQGLNKVTPKKKTNQRMIAPFLLFFLMFFVALWSYSVIAIYPEYQKKIAIQKLQTSGDYEEGVSEVPEVATNVQSINLKELFYLGILSFIICGGLFFLTALKIKSLNLKPLSEIQTASTMLKAAKMIEAAKED